MIATLKANAGYIFIAGTILLTVYGQIVFKWRVDLAGISPETISEKIVFYIPLLLNPWIISSYAAAFLASFSWMIALSYFDLSFAYPFTILSFVMVTILGAILFHEVLTPPRIIGLVLIILGVLVVSRS